MSVESSFGYVGIIPARYASSRFPGKPLVDILGKPMIWHVYNAAERFSKWRELVVATDDKRIHETCDELRIKCVMTSANHKDCIDRGAETAETLVADGRCEETDRFVIIQGDEPTFDPSVLNTDLSPDTVNFYTSITKEEELSDKNVVKVVISKSLRAIYFSRRCIPFASSVTRKSSDKLQVDKQVGIYSFSLPALRKFRDLGMSYLEGLEGIGLLRLIENDVPIHMRYSQCDNQSVDVPQDIEKVVNLMRNR